MTDPVSQPTGQPVESSAPVNVDVRVADAPERSRYEITVDGRLVGFAVYERAGDRVVFVHTEVAEQLEGLHLGSTLARAALDDVRRRGLQATPLCPFIRGWIVRHPGYADLVDPAHRHLLEQG